MGVVRASSQGRRPCLLDAPGDLGGGGSLAHAAQLLIGHRRNFDMQIDPVEQRTTDLAQVSLDDRTRAATLMRGVAEKSTRTPVQLTTAAISGLILMSDRSVTTSAN